MPLPGSGRKGQSARGALYSRQVNRVPAEVIQCPRCRTICYPGLMGYPRCHRCHEQLRQCLHCRHQVGGLCQLPEADRPPLRDEDGAPFCTAFASRFTRGGSTWWQRPLAGWQRHAAMGALILAVALVAGLMLRGRGELAPRLMGPDGARRDAAGTVLVTLSVVADPHRYDEITLQVVRRQPDAYRLYASPTPLDSGPGQSGALRFAVPRNGRLELELELRPRRAPPPPERLELRLLGPAGELFDTATVVLP